MLLDRRLSPLQLLLVLLLPLLAQQQTSHAWIAHDPDTPGGPPQSLTPRIRAELLTFPYSGPGDLPFSFHNPFRPTVDAPIDGWIQLGSAVVLSSDNSAHDVVRLTHAAPGNQGILYATHHTTTNDFNGYFDLHIGTSPASHEPADGMGFFLTERPPVLGSAMGLHHSFRGLAIIIDTFSNSRARSVPYLYAYVSNGDTPWNPEADGADIQLTQGCTLPLDRPIRVYVQFVDTNLHVALATDRNHDRWHTCFRYNNVPMPFSYGGHLAFAAETGHHFAFHDLHAAAFVVGDVHNDPYERQRIQEDAARSQQQMQQDLPQDHHHPPEEHSDNAPFADGQHPGYHEGAQSPAVPQGETSAAEHLSSSMDAKLNQVYGEFADVIRAHIGHGTTDELIRKTVEELQQMTGRLLQEMEAQSQQLTEGVQHAVSVKSLASDLRQLSQQFSADVTKIHHVSERISHSSKINRADHSDTTHVLVDHAESLGASLYHLNKKRSNRFLPIFVFLLSQVVLAAGFAVVYKMGSPSRKPGRLV